MSEQFVFEKAMKRLEEIVTSLEKGEASLEDSLALFEEGTKLIRQCGLSLDNAEKKLRQLIKTPEGPEEADFEVGK